MNRDVLERLATDRALGALPPDVQVLFDAYAQLDPQAASATGEIDQTVGLARHALADQPASSMPAFPTAGFLQIEQWRRRMVRLTYAAGLAACLTIGLGLGRATAPAEPPRQVYVQVPVPQALARAPKPASASTVRDSSDFWSVDRLRQQREQVQADAAGPTIRRIELPWLGWQQPT